MANLTEVSQWENVIRQIENGEAATGGADGLANVQAKQLANRTKWLKDNLAPIVNAAFSGTLEHGGNDLAGAAIVAKSNTETGYIKYANGVALEWGEMTANNASKEITLPVNGTICSVIAIPVKRESSDTVANVSYIELTSNKRKSFIVHFSSAVTRFMWFAIVMSYYGGE